MLVVCVCVRACVCSWQKFEFETEPRAQCLIKTKYSSNIYTVYTLISSVGISVRVFATHFSTGICIVCTCVRGTQKPFILSWFMFVATHISEYEIHLGFSCCCLFFFSFHFCCFASAISFARSHVVELLELHSFRVVALWSLVFVLLQLKQCKALFKNAYRFPFQWKETKRSEQPQQPWPILNFSSARKFVYAGVQLKLNS